VRERNGVLAAQGIDVAYNVYDMSAKKVGYLLKPTDSIVRRVQDVSLVDCVGADGPISIRLPQDSAVS
jgi:hypothetical protein